MEPFTRLWKSQDLFAAIESLFADDDPVKCTKGCGDLVKYLYWKEKNLPAVVIVASAGIACALRKASEMPEGDSTAQELRGLAKGMAYDLGSFTWPGWDEPGIAIGPTDLAIGREAAKANLRLALELGRGDLPLSRAHWLVGAHDLAAGDWNAARTSFKIAEKHAQAAGQPAAALMNAAYIRLAEALAAPEDTAKQAAVAEAEEKIGSADGGKDLQGQVTTALRVFLKAQSA